MIRGPQGITILTFLAAMVAVLPVGGLRRDRAWIRGNVAEYVEEFSIAADLAGRGDDWPDPDEHSPGTAVMIEFEPNRAAITLAADPQFGMARLITAARNIAEKAGYLAAHIRTDEDVAYIAAQIDMSQAIHRDRLTQSWNLSLDQTAKALREAGVPKPVIIAIDPGGALAPGTNRIRLRERRYIRYLSVRNVGPGQIIHFHARGSGLDLAIFECCGLSLILAILLPWWLIRFSQRDPFENGPEMDPEEGQRRYERGPPRCLWYLIDPVLVIFPLCVVWALEYYSSTAITTLQIILPLSQKRLAIILMALAALSALALLIRARFNRPHSDSERSQPGLIRRAARLALLLPAIAIWIPLLLERDSRPLSSTAALELLAWAFLSIFTVGRFIRIRQLSRRKEIREGLWYQMAHEVAATGGLTLKKVLMLNIPQANGFAWESGVIGVSERLVTHLDPGEVRAILAHELAHVQRQDVHKRLWILRAIYILLFASAPGIAVAFHIDFEPAFAFTLAGLGLLSPLMTLAIAAMSRRCEFAADRQAAEWVGDPELMARALIRIYTLNRWPTHFRPIDEVFASHPSLVYRVARLREMPGSSAMMSLE